MPKKCILCGDPVCAELDDRYCPACEKLYYEATLEAREHDKQEL